MPQREGLPADLLVIYDMMRLVPPSQREAEYRSGNSVYRPQYRVPIEQMIVGVPGEPLRAVVVHYMSGALGWGTPDNIHQWHTSKPPNGNGWDAPGYQFHIDREGMGTSLRPTFVTAAANGAPVKDPAGIGPAQTRNGHTLNIGLALGERETPTPAMMHALNDFLHGVQRGYDYKLPVLGHVHFKDTACPGGINYACLLNLDKAGRMSPERPALFDAADAIHQRYAAKIGPFNVYPFVDDPHLPRVGRLDPRVAGLDTGHLTPGEYRALTLLNEKYPVIEPTHPEALAKPIGASEPASSFRYSGVRAPSTGVALGGTLLAPVIAGVTVTAIALTKTTPVQAALQGAEAASKSLPITRVQEAEMQGRPDEAALRQFEDGINPFLNAPNIVLGQLARTKRDIERVAGVPGADYDHSLPGIVVGAVIEVGKAVKDAVVGDKTPAQAKQEPDKPKGPHVPLSY